MDLIETCLNYLSTFINPELMAEKRKHDTETKIAENLDAYDIEPEGESEIVQNRIRRLRQSNDDMIDSDFFSSEETSE